LTFTIDKRLFFYLVFAFIAATIIGTVSHECGHYIAARLMGFKAYFNYEMTWLATDNRIMTRKQTFWFILAGPLQTMLTGTIAFLFLYNSPKPTGKLSPGQWTLAFLSLFWLRQSANFVIWIVQYLITGFFGDRTDEINLSVYLHLPFWSIISITAITGLVVLTIVLFRFIPKPQRLTFILSGLTGGISGYLLWLVYFGEIIMP
jgi:hypothetical protein